MSDEKNKIDWGKFEESWPVGWQKNCTVEFVLSDAFFQEKAAWLKPAAGKTFNQQSCPAKCKRSGTCYAKAYFTHKAGKGVPCAGQACHWRDSLDKMGFSPF